MYSSGLFHSMNFNRVGSKYTVLRMKNNACNSFCASLWCLTRMVKALFCVWRGSAIWSRGSAIWSRVPMLLAVLHSSHQRHVCCCDASAHCTGIWHVNPNIFVLYWCTGRKTWPRASHNSLSTDSENNLTCLFSSTVFVNVWPLPSSWFNVTAAFGEAASSGDYVTSLSRWTRCPDFDGEKLKHDTRKHKKAAYEEAFLVLPSPHVIACDCVSRWRSF